VKRDELKSAREKYRYVPARLVRPVDAGSNAALAWKSLRLVTDVPSNWRNADDTAKYSSFELDEFHRKLLNSDKDEDLMHGLLSVVFWGFASGTQGRITAERALSKCRAIINGRQNAKPQASEEIISHLGRARELLNGSHISDALLEAMKIKFVKMSFASKVLAFMKPAIAAVYDDVISSRLMKSTESILRNMYVSTKLTQSHKARSDQANKYEDWCHWCSEEAEALKRQNVRWTDWNGKEKDWRALDVERAFFALGRGEEAA
jgi:hypothetical protein